MRKALMAVAMLLLATVLMVGCTESLTGPFGEADRSTGTIEVRVHDAPAGYEITEIWISVDSVEVHRAAAEREREEGPDETPTPTVSASPSAQPTVTPVSEPTVSPTNTATPPVQNGSGVQTNENEGDAGWMPLTVSGSNPFELLQYQDGLDMLLATDEMETGKYTQIRMAVSKVEIHYLDGESNEPQVVEAEIPSGKLKFVRPFDVLAGGTTVLSFDFVADESVIFTGSGKVIFKPVIKLDISYEDSNAEPTQTPAPGVTGTPTATASPAANGSEEIPAGENGPPDGKPEGGKPN
ncbi:MAG: DUF4382 domain-containing protein [Dehalococcoidia bacterium]